MNKMLPQQILESPPQNKIKIDQMNVQQNLHRKFVKFMKGQRQQNLKQRLRNFHGKNYAIDYRPQFKFTQQWEGKGGNQRQSDRNLLQQNGIGYFLFSLAFMAVNIATIWTLSIERYFDTNIISQSTYIFQILLAFIIVDIGLNIYYQYSQNDSYRLDFLRELKTNKKHLAVSAYLFYFLYAETQGIEFYFIEIATMGLLYAKAAEIYKCMKVTQWSLKYENQMKILDLLFNVFIQAHVFAIILFTASKLNPDKNWVENTGISQEKPFTKYIYSFYFASTTMLTIGYGDITPKCTEEIIITVLIEIVAVVSFGYLLNEMGHTLSKMRQQSEELERDLQTISKISKYYNLERKLQNRAKSFLFNNQVKSEELKGDDENRVLMKLDEELRLGTITFYKEINHENSLTVVKSCIFFLCHWSKNMQSEIAKRLEKRLFSPNEKLLSANGSSRVYIVKRGRIDIFMNRYNSNQEHRKLLKVVNTKTHDDVSDNIYGYTTVFSNRPVRLEAIAKEFTSTYSVNNCEFLECIRQNVHDFEYYHEIKCRIDQSSFCEEWEAPSIKNIREHFAPSRIILIKKFRKMLSKSSNHRKFSTRRITTQKSQLIHNYIKRDSGLQNSTNMQKTLIFTCRKFNIERLSEQEVRSNEEQPLKSQVQELVSEEDSIRQSYEQAMASFKTRSRTIALDERANKQLISHNFEVNKEFFNFFRRNNITSVLQSFENENFRERNIHRNYIQIDNQKLPLAKTSIKIYQ